MAANKFATMLHRNTNRITLILTYAVLEWILILLLLLNSLFSHLIVKFAEFFGLKPPCLWCTRVDHIIDSENGNKNVHRDILCEVHAKQISKLGYCSTHRKLSESRDMCEDCSSSRPEIQDLSKNFASFPWMKEFGVIQNHREVGENGEVSLNCSCCGVTLDKSMCSSYIALKTSSLDVLECAEKENLSTEIGNLCDNHIKKGCYYENEMISELHENIEVTEKGRKDNDSISLFVNEMKELEKGDDGKDDEVLGEMVEKMENVEEKVTLIMKNKSVRVCVEGDAPLEILPQHLEFFLDYSGHRLVQFELMDSITEEIHNKDNVKIEGDDNIKEQSSSMGCEIQVGEEEDLVMNDRRRFLDVDINEEPKFATLESMEMEMDENSLVFHAKDCCFVSEEFENFTNFPAYQFPSEDASDVREMVVAAGEMQSDTNAACEELAEMENSEHEADVSIGTDIPDLDIANEIQNQESVRVYECTNEDPSTSSANLLEADDHGPMQIEDQKVELQCLSFHSRKHMTNNQLSFSLEINGIEEDKVPDTPTSVDGSFMSELEGSDGTVTIERLKSALRAERKALQALYVELEEERSASAEAASQTMAMINRLQEEKAAMQMEAFQYQRMMEEQSEYDQEALQLLNEVMVKREKDKQELEKELELCRKKLLDYERKERIRVLRMSNGSTRSGFSSASEDSDGLFIDLNQDAKEEERSCSHEEFCGEQNTPVDAVLNLEESLADFEEERVSILVQLKVLEEKLMALDDENEEQFEDVIAIEDFHEENGKQRDESAHLDGEANGHSNGFLKEMNGKHHQPRRIGGRQGKSLLPLFDATGDGNGFDSKGVHNLYVSKLVMENKKFAIEEEIDHVCERLQALEADREFLRHCVSSLRKGDKGLVLLQEILQHLRDLRNIWSFVQEIKPIVL